MIVIKNSIRCVLINKEKIISIELVDSNDREIQPEEDFSECYLKIYITPDNFYRFTIEKYKSFETVQILKDLQKKLSSNSIDLIEV